MGQRITKLKPVGGFCAETGGAMTLFLATALGIPVSTTHTITGAIVGVGAVRNVGRCAGAWPATSSGPGCCTIPGRGLRRRGLLLRRPSAVLRAGRPIAPAAIRRSAAR